MTISEKLLIGQRILQERKKRSWSQPTLAKKISDTDDVQNLVQNINRWEKGKTLPQPHYRAKLSEVFGLSLQELFSELFDEPETADIPSIWNVPHLRNLYFTGREDILAQLHTTLNSKKTVALSQPSAISGLGGIGKTQTAIEYAYRYSNDYKAVLWVRADSHEALISNFVALADVLKLPEKNEADQSRVVAAVKHWLQEHTQWLLILDNADDLEMVYDFLLSRGHTLLTTRSQITGPNIKKIELEKMSPEEGTLFLLRRAKLIAEDATLEDASGAQRKDAEANYELVDGLPLALDQAAAYIEENECSLSDYLTLYQTRRAALLKRRGTFSKRDYPKPVTTTWSLSFEQVQHDHPAAADLLRLCAFLHPDAIPEEMIVAGASELGPTLQPVAEDPIQLADAIGALRKYSLVRRNPKMKTLTIHRLVQTVLRDGMDSKMQREWAERTLKVVNRAFPDLAEFSIPLWPKCQQYLPHVQVCKELTEQWRIETVEAARLFDQAGVYLRDRAQYLEAEDFLQRALAIREQTLGLTHPDVARSLNNLATLYWNQGRYTKAELLFQRALTIREQTPGSNHPNVAQSLNNLALLCHDQGKYEQAESLYQRSFAIWEQALGLNHPDVATSLNNLGRLYHAQGKYDQAEPLHQRALAIREQALGPNHPYMAYSLNNLGRLYHALGKYDQAEALFQRALSIREQSLGTEHPDVAETLNGLARLYHAQGKYEQAESLHQRALAIWEQAGPNHPDVAYSLNGLARLYHAQGKYEQAASLFQCALTIREQALGPNHPDVAEPLTGLAALYRDQSRYDQAEALFQRALSIREQSLGIEHPDVAETLNDFAQLYDDQGKYIEAEQLFQRALSIREKSLGPAHPDVATTLNNLALLYQAQDKYEPAESLFQRALAICEQALGPHHPHKVEILENYASLLRKMDRETEAVPLEERAKAIRTALNQENL